MPRPHSLAANLAKGALAGAVATFVMGHVTAYLYDQESPRAKRKERRARRGRSAQGEAAQKAAALFGNRLTAAERERLGTAIQWGLGIGMGALYAALRDRFDEVGASRGIAFGTLFWGAVDETLNPVLGLSPSPDEIPLQAHGRVLAGHLTFGVVADGTLRVLDRLF